MATSMWPDCQLTYADGMATCSVCGKTYKAPGGRLRANCKPRPEPAAPAPPQEGPGTELKSLLATFGIHASPTCKCNSMARKMNDMESKEPGWCLSHIEEIVDVMEETAKARKLPFLRTAGKLLVKKAVKNWHKKATGK